MKNEGKQASGSKQSGLRTVERPGVVGCNVAAADVVQQWSSRTSRDDGDGKTVVGASAGPSAMAPLYVVRRRVAGPTCRRPARLRTDTTRLAC